MMQKERLLEPGYPLVFGGNKILGGNKPVFEAKFPINGGNKTRKSGNKVVTKPVFEAKLVVTNKMGLFMAGGNKVVTKLDRLKFFLEQLFGGNKVVTSYFETEKNHCYHRYHQNIGYPTVNINHYQIKGGQ